METQTDAVHRRGGGSPPPQVGLLDALKRHVDEAWNSQGSIAERRTQAALVAGAGIAAIVPHIAPLSGVRRGPARAWIETGEFSDRYRDLVDELYSIALADGGPEAVGLLADAGMIPSTSILLNAVTKGGTDEVAHVIRAAKAELGILDEAARLALKNARIGPLQELLKAGAKPERSALCDALLEAGWMELRRQHLARQPGATESLIKVEADLALYRDAIAFAGGDLDLAPGLTWSGAAWAVETVAEELADRRGPLSSAESRRLANVILAEAAVLPEEALRLRSLPA